MQIIAGLGSLGVAACTGDPLAAAAGTESSSGYGPLPGRAEIIAAAYDATYQVPEDFLVDERADTPRSYTLHHVRDESGSYELCSDDYRQAQEWEAADNERRQVNGYIVGSNENERYFEFVRELYYADNISAVPEPTSPGFARVFKCSMVNRSGVDLHVAAGYGGVLNYRPLTVDLVRELAEYLWQFEFFGTSRPKVLDSFATESAGSIRHTLLTATLFPRGFGNCDRIEVAEWNHIADKATGVLGRESRFRFAIAATSVAGDPRECN